MKRGAEKQLSKDDGDGGDEETEEVPRGFRKADDSELARRKMRALPRRMGGAAPAVSAPAVPEPEPATATGEASVPPSEPQTRFGGFAGFGSGGSNTFSFANPVSASNTVKPTPAPSFSAFAPISNPPATAASASPPVSATASAATKSFASFLGTSSTNNAASASSSPPSSKLETNGTDDSAALRYYMSLRGLNVSFIKAITKAVEEDPFVDIVSLMERYKSLRIEVQSEFDKGSKSTPESNATDSSKGASSSKPFGPAPSMPAPPTSFAGFGSFASTPASSSPGGGFVPKLDSTNTSTKSSGFSFSNAPPLSSSDKPSGFSFPSAPPQSLSVPSKLPFSLTPASTSFKPTSDDSSKPDEPTKPATSAFLLGTPTSSSSDKSETTLPFSFPSSTADKKTPSAFPAGIFGTSKDKDKPSPISNLFGGSAFGTSTAGKSEKTASSGSLFGGTATASGTSSFSGFGKPSSGSIGNPVGFGFGSPPRRHVAMSGEGTRPKFSSSSFGFGSAAKSEDVMKEVEDKNESQSEEKEGGEVAADEDAPKLFSNSVHDLEGVGEEEEDTTHSVRSKVYRFTKNPEDEKGKWVDMGIGILRLKKHKETDSRRMLLRNTSTGRVLINFKIYASMTSKVNSKSVSFTGHEEGHAVNYQLRVKSVEDAEQLNKALTREIEFVKGQSE